MTNDKYEELKKQSLQLDVEIELNYYELEEIEERNRELKQKLEDTIKQLEAIAFDGLEVVEAALIINNNKKTPLNHPFEYIKINPLVGYCKDTSSYIHIPTNLGMKYPPTEDPREIVEAANLIYERCKDDTLIMSDRSDDGIGKRLLSIINSVSDTFRKKGRAR